MEVQRCAFIVRIWSEDDATQLSDSATGAVLRGSIQRVDARAVRYFASLEQVAELIAEMLPDESR